MGSDVIAAEIQDAVINTLFRIGEYKHPKIFCPRWMTASWLFYKVSTLETVIGFVENSGFHSKTGMGVIGISNIQIKERV